MDKKEQRRAALDKRRFIEDKDLKSDLIASKLTKMALGYEKIGIYLNTVDEVQTGKVIKALKYKNKEVYVPTCIQNNLEFHEFSSFDDLIPGKYSILEAKGKIDNDLDIIFIPLVAFDEDKHRLGMGKGYYDTFLKNFKGLKVGVAFEEQKVTQIECEEHDVDLDMIISETAIYL